VSEARAQFALLKSLEGEWSGTTQHEGKFEPVRVQYRVSGNGTVVEETLFKGTPHEMISMYHLDGDRLMMTHYCTTGNQPRMISDASTDDPKSIKFDFLDATNMQSDDAMHMHSMHLTLRDPNHLDAWWQSWAKGEPGPEAHFEFTRTAAR
ncbi:MAG: hypothetical protein ACRETX_11950, partial [Steroidobacteraceae bacterium]